MFQNTALKAITRPTPAIIRGMHFLPISFQPWGLPNDP
jgi:hypothetical protein